uniref:Uncharacterized protein n=1 Tax=Arundo donax TaxID=35708 RepID=A0A0A9BNZ5_ARUDO
MQFVIYIFLFSFIDYCDHFLTIGIALGAEGCMQLRLIWGLAEAPVTGHYL